jgi:hypothetical protein
VGKEFLMRTKKILTGFLVFCLVAAAGLPACSKSFTEDSGESAGQSLTIVWVGEETVIDVSSIMEMDAVEKEVSTINSDNEESTRKVKGILLEDVLKSYLDISMDEIYSMRFSAGDGYGIEVPPEVLRNAEIILAYEIDGGPLEDDVKPFRSVIPEERSMYWVKNLVNIELFQNRGEKEINAIVFIDTLVKTLSQQDYDYYGNMDKAVLAEDLLMEFREGDSQDHIIMISSDGLEKNELTEIFREGFIKITGENAPAFVDPEIPKGIWVKDILMILYGHTAYASAARALKVFEETMQGEKSGITVQDLVNETGLSTSAGYILRALDGYTVELTADELRGGLLYFDEEEQLNIYFEGLPGKYSVKNLLSIENK